MKEFWRFMLCIFYVMSWSFCCSSLNDEGLALLKMKEKIENDPHSGLSNWVEEVGVENPCSWSGVGCLDGHVVVLNLADLCLKGTLSSDIGNLIHIKSINLCNNSFYGLIPEEVANLKELEVFDLRNNNFSGQLPCHLGNNFSTMILLLDSDELLRVSCPEATKMLFEPEQASCNGLVISWKSRKAGNLASRKLLQALPRRVPPLVIYYAKRNPTTVPQRPIAVPAPISPPSPSPSPSPLPSEPPPSSSANNRTSLLSPPPQAVGKSRPNLKVILPIAIGGPALLLVLSIIVVVCYKSGKITAVNPSTGLSGQLQRAFVTGVPKLKRSELEAACEDFSNVIGSLTICTLYKGTLSSGVEIAVASIGKASLADWSSTMESQFREKIDTLSKVNHKNFINLIGYCEEEEPFTRMMVFEYAPNGTLFEHLHIKEAEHLDWEMRLRIAMGIAYCIDNMHQMTPEIVHRNLTSSSIYLTEDYAAKVSDFIYWDKVSEDGDLPSSTPPSNVYSFGVILYEIITGKLPYSSGADSADDWASDYLKGVQSLRERVDPILRTYQEDQLQQLQEVIKLCIDQDPGQRPSMRDVCTKLRTITGIGPDGAVPKMSPLWWAEIEIQSSEDA